MVDSIAKPAVVFAVFYALAWVTDGVIFRALDEIRELYWVGLASAFGVAVALWSVVIGLFRLVSETSTQLTSEERATRRKRLIGLGDEIAANGAFAGGLLATALILAVLEQIPEPQWIPTWLSAIRFPWFSGSARLAIGALSAWLLIDLFLGMRQIGQIYAELAKPKQPSN